MIQWLWSKGLPAMIKAKPTLSVMCLCRVAKEQWGIHNLVDLNPPFNTQSQWKFKSPFYEWDNISSGLGGKGINVVEALSSARVIYAVKHNSNKQLLIKT